MGPSTSQAPKTHDDDDYDYELLGKKENAESWSLSVVDNGKGDSAATNKKEDKDKRKLTKRTFSAKSRTKSKKAPIRRRSANIPKQNRRRQTKFLEVKMGGKKISERLQTRRDTARVRSAPRTRGYIYSGRTAQTIQRKTVVQF